MGPNSCDIGMIGLGIMGRNLVLNMLDQGFSVAGFDSDATQVTALQTEGANKPVFATQNLQDFIKHLKKPRAVMILVPAGAPVDAVIKELTECLEPGDLILDGGNSYFKDSDIHARNLQPKNIEFMGVGISGGEQGARLGPSIMPGGTKTAYERVRPIFEKIAAKAFNEPCVALLGNGSSGHFVKMVHNGIEYGIMQILSEAYDFMKRGILLSNDEIQKVFASWDAGDLGGYLVEITAQIFLRKDDKSKSKLIDEILGVAEQNGTGMWTSQNAMELQVCMPTIDMAVTMRDMSELATQRQEASILYKETIAPLACDKDVFLQDLHNAVYASSILTYAQGFAHLNVASKKYNYQISLETVARIWRGGCIIRSKFLEDITRAFKQEPDLANLLLDSAIAQKISENQQSLRTIVGLAAATGIPASSLMASLSYFDAYKSVWLPTNLIQAQRDYFGSHKYERIDSKGTYHTQWQAEGPGNTR